MVSMVSPCVAKQRHGSAIAQELFSCVVVARTLDNGAREGGDLLGNARPVRCVFAFGSEDVSTDEQGIDGALFSRLTT